MKDTAWRRYGQGASRTKLVAQSATSASSGELAAPHRIDASARSRRGSNFESAGPLISLGLYAAASSSHRRRRPRLADVRGSNFVGRLILVRYVPLSERIHVGHTRSLLCNIAPPPGRVGLRARPPRSPLQGAPAVEFRGEPSPTGERCQTAVRGECLQDKLAWFTR
jgi:hypothetical protein